MSAILNPKVGFCTPHRENVESGTICDQTKKKISNSGVEAARRKFPPEFVNRAFLGLYANAMVPAGTPLVVVCGAPRDARTPPRLPFAKRLP